MADSLTPPKCCCRTSLMIRRDDSTPARPLDAQRRGAARSSRASSSRRSLHSSGSAGSWPSTGYPRIGSNGIHIAHMLWGGLLMLLALMLLLAFLDRSVQHLAAVIAGLGFRHVHRRDREVRHGGQQLLLSTRDRLDLLPVRPRVSRRPDPHRPRRLSETEALANALDLLEGTPEGRSNPMTEPGSSDSSISPTRTRRSPCSRSNTSPISLKRRSTRALSRPSIGDSPTATSGSWRTRGRNGSSASASSPTPRPRS